jgi:hypothetical protein
MASGRGLYWAAGLLLILFIYLKMSSGHSSGSDSSPELDALQRSVNLSAWDRLSDDGIPRVTWLRRGPTASRLIILSLDFDWKFEVTVDGHVLASGRWSADELAREVILRPTGAEVEVHVPAQAFTTEDAPAAILDLFEPDD